MKTYGGWLYSSTILNIGVVRFTPMSLYFRETATGTDCVGDRVGFRVGMGVMKKRKSKTFSSADQPVASSLEK
jgi:hypothetical protein